MKIESIAYEEQYINHFDPTITDAVDTYFRTWSCL